LTREGRFCFIHVQSRDSEVILTGQQDLSQPAADQTHSLVAAIGPE
jgi:hypothetical protein